MPQELLEAYDTLLKSLWDRMTIMLGRITTHSLMERALFETSKETGIVNELALTDQGLDFSGLERRDDQVDAGDLRDAMNSLVVNVVGLLAEQVGRAMAAQIARKAGVEAEDGEE